MAHRERNGDDHSKTKDGCEKDIGRDIRKVKKIAE
jgi:hypothetical protein